ncbi:MAG: hypothetical protein QXU87_03895 [Candidatus Caldarchaeum sp.]
MRMAAVLGTLLGVGVFAQILLGETGFAAGSLRDVHAIIGLLGLAVVIAYAVTARGSLARLAAASFVALITFAQVVLGLSLYGLLSIGMGHEALKLSHRATAYVLFLSGLAVTVFSMLSRRRAKT